MKKSIFILAALFATTFANAQITLEHTFDGLVSIHTTYSPREYNAHTLSPSITPYFYSYQRNEQGKTCILTLFDKDNYNTYKTVNLDAMQIIGLNDREYSLGFLYALTYDVFADNKVAFIVELNYNVYGPEGQYWGIEPTGYAIIDEDGIVLMKFMDSEGYTYYDYNSFDEYIEYPYIARIGNNYKLIMHRVEKSDESKSKIYTEIYSLPGDGDEVQSVSSPNISNRSAARKFTRNGQVLVQTDNNTYSIQGQEIK